MEFKILLFIAFLSVAIVVSHAALPSEEYWNSVLPNTPKPKAVKDLLQPSSGRRGRRLQQLLFWGSAATETELHNAAAVSLFFLEEDLYAGNKMSIDFSEHTNEKTFLPRHAAGEMPEKYRDFCNDAAGRGEERFCATSMESMIASATALIGRPITAASTEVGCAGKKVYRVEAVAGLGRSGTPVVACHKKGDVFLCHKLDATVAYGVSLVAADGATAKAVATCHHNTSQWNPDHLAMKVLKVKPGTVPVCHFLPQYNIVWVSKN